MENPANDQLDDAPPQVALNAGPVAKKRGNGPLVMLFGVLGAAFAVLVGLMSRSVAAPQASAASPTPSRTAAVARLAADEVPAASRWTNGARWVSDRKSVAFELKSVNRVNVWMGQVQPLLVVRCTANRTETFVYTETAARIEPGMEDRAVRVGLDDEPYVDERWLDSAEHKGLFAPNGETFTHRLVNARTLRFQFTPHNAETAEVQFNVAGLRELLSPVQKKCGWNK
jgi:hypothetical protein